MYNHSGVEVRLGKDPELRYTPQGTAVVNFSGANNMKWKDKERTDWISFVAWGKLAEIISQYLKKGSRAMICGRLQSRKWDDKDGVTRYVTEVRANDVSFLDPKSGQTVAAKESETEAEVGEVAEDSDIPF